MHSEVELSHAAAERGGGCVDVFSHIDNRVRGRQAQRRGQVRDDVLEDIQHAARELGRLFGGGRVGLVRFGEQPTQQTQKPFEAVIDAVLVGRVALGVGLREELLRHCRQPDAAAPAPISIVVCPALGVRDEQREQTCHGRSGLMLTLLAGARGS